MTEPSRHILVVEDSRFFSGAVKERFESQLDLKVTLAPSYGDAERLLNEDHPEFFLSVLDLDLPDAPLGTVVDLVQGKGIPVIVFTAGVSDGVREDLWQKKIVDYILKGSTNSLDYLSSLVRRIDLNRNIELLVADDSAFIRKQVTDLLRAHQYTVHEATDGTEAMLVLKKHPGIKLLLTDYEMPNMDGVKLTETVRRTHGRDDLAIIGISSSHGTRLSAKFLKSGANDFIRKPFEAEEFYCRINQNIEMLEHIAMIREASERDFLTGLYNRRHFFEVGRTMFANASRHNLTIALAMIDIDHFKKVNDTHGHDTGDLVLRRVAAILKKRFRQADVVSRIGGEEFCVLGVNVSRHEAFSLFDTVRTLIEQQEIDVGDAVVRASVSVGVCLDQLGSLEDMISAADSMLYAAKEGGRNRVEVYSPKQPEEDISEQG